MKKKENIKWSKIESCFEPLFVEYCNLSEDGKAEINNRPNNFDRHFFARTAAAVCAMENDLIQHSLPANVLELIDSSIIEDLPDWCPSFLKSFYLVFKNPQKGIKALWGFYKAPFLIICGEQVNGGLISSLFLIDFENKKYDFGKDDLYSDDGLFFVKFLLTFSLLLEAEKSPIVLKKDLLRCSPSVYGRKMTKTLFTARIKEDFERRLKEDKLVHVKGFLRNQACGVNWSERKVIYIAPFERIQKVNKEE